jgi:LysM repeat protein
MGIVVSGETPQASPTPSQYTIRSGDTLGQIADRLGISLDELLVANPGVDPNALPVGQSLTIPGSLVGSAGEPTPTPVPFLIEQIACHSIANGAVWCFILIRNESPDVVENVTARVTLVDSQGQPTVTGVALLPLDILLPGASLPLGVFFPPPVAVGTRPQVQVLTAIALLPGDQRYLPAVIRRSLAEVSWRGRSAALSGEVFLPETSVSAGVIWIAAVAYDGSGNVVGFRRWESEAGLPAGSSLPFAFMVSSVAGRIERVEFAVEARP